MPMAPAIVVSVPSQSDVAAFAPFVASATACRSFGTSFPSFCIFSTASFVVAATRASSFSVNCAMPSDAADGLHHQ